MTRVKLSLKQAQSEGWTLSTNPIAIQPLDPLSATSARGKVLTEALGGSDYHLAALHAVLTSCLDAFRIRPDVKVGDWVKLTEMVRGPEGQPAILHSGEVAQVRDVNDLGINLTLSDFSVHGFVDHSDPNEPWFPFTKVETFNVVHQGVTLIVDRSTGAVLQTLSPDELNSPDLSFVKWVDVADLIHAFGDIPDNIDLELVTYADRDGDRTVADRRAWIQKQLADIDPVLARVVATQTNP